MIVPASLFLDFMKEIRVESLDVKASMERVTLGLPKSVLRAPLYLRMKKGYCLLIHFGQDSILAESSLS